MRNTLPELTEKQMDALRAMPLESIHTNVLAEQTRILLEPILPDCSAYGLLIAYKSGLLRRGYAPLTENDQGIPPTDMMIGFVRIALKSVLEEVLGL